MENSILLTVPHVPSADKYISWVSTFYKYFELDSKEYLVVRYEDLIFDYEAQKEKIERYLGLSKHNSPKSCFDPSISCKYVGMWKQSNLNPDLFNIIQQRLSQYCYEL